MIALGDLLQITDFQTLLGQQVLNVFHYRCTSITGLDDTAYDAILDWYDANIMDVMTNIQHAQLTHNRLFIQNLSNGVDFVDRALSPVVPGEYTDGEVMPPFVSWSFRLIRETLATRNGAKRIGGVPELVVQNGVVLPAFVGAVNGFADALASDIVIGLVTIAEPIIVKRPITVPAGAYVYSSVGDADYRQVSTQNTRKFGRGS